jgi:hypothetical protein
MTDNVIELDKRRKLTAVLKRHSAGRINIPGTELFFPQIYRRVAVGWTEDDNHRGVPGLRQFIEYTLSNVDDHQHASSIFMPIDHIDSEWDDGWLVLRHHLTEESSSSYTDANMDYPIDPFPRQTCFQTSDGFFTLVHYPPLPELPNFLTCFYTSSDYDWSLVIDKDGKEFTAEILQLVKIEVVPDSWLPPK